MEENDQSLLTTMPKTEAVWILGTKTAVQVSAPAKVASEPMPWWPHTTRCHLGHQAAADSISNFFGS